jgi:Ca-activated chloride channel family protein
MFTSKKDRQFIDYQDSYYYQQQRRKRRGKWLKGSLVLSILLLFIVVFSLLFVPFAQSSDTGFEKKVTSGNSTLYDSNYCFHKRTPFS